MAKGKSKGKLKEKQESKPDNLENKNRISKVAILSIVISMLLVSY
jgi:hypothetical protein